MENSFDNKLDVKNDKKKLSNISQSLRDIHLNYDPLKIPPDWELARKHGVASKVGRKSDLPLGEICPCCGMEILREDLAVFGSTTDLYFLGPGYFVY